MISYNMEFIDHEFTYKISVWIIHGFTDENVQKMYEFIQCCCTKSDRKHIAWVARAKSEHTLSAPTRLNSAAQIIAATRAMINKTMMKNILLCWPFRRPGEGGGVGLANHCATSALPTSNKFSSVPGCDDWHAWGIRVNASEYHWVWVKCVTKIYKSWPAGLMWLNAGSSGRIIQLETRIAQR